QAGSPGAEATNCARVVLRAGPVRPLRVPQPETEPPVVRRLPPEARQHAVEPGDLDGHGFRERLACDAMRLLQLARERAEIADRAADGRAGRACKLLPGPIPDVVKVVGERHLGAPGDPRSGN